MKLREKVLKALRDENASVSGTAEEILISPKKVLKALEYLTDIEGGHKCASMHTK